MRVCDRVRDVAAQAREAGLGGNELLLELGAPGRMGEVAGADHADAFAARPGGEVLEIEIPARRPRVFRVDVQVRVEAHVSHARAARLLQPSIWKKRGEGIRS